MGRIERMRGCEDVRMRGCEDVRMKIRGCMTHNTGLTPIYIVNKFNFKPLWIKRQDRSKVSPTYNFNNTKTLSFHDNRKYTILFRYLISENEIKNFNIWLGGGEEG